MRNSLAVRPAPTTRGGDCGLSVSHYHAHGQPRRLELKNRRELSGGDGGSA